MSSAFPDWNAVFSALSTERNGRPALGAERRELLQRPQLQSRQAQSRRSWKQIVNFAKERGYREGPPTYGSARVRYSSSRRFKSKNEDVPSTSVRKDFLGKRTALFGMTAHRKVQHGQENHPGHRRLMNAMARQVASTSKRIKAAEGSLHPFDNRWKTKVTPVGQIIFDINGEYANRQYARCRGRRSTSCTRTVTPIQHHSKSPDFKVMKINFYNDVEGGL